MQGISGSSGSFQAFLPGRHSEQEQFFQFPKPVGGIGGYSGSALLPFLGRTIPLSGERFRQRQTQSDLRQAGYCLFEDQPSQAKQWSEEQIERLWYGQANQVIETLNAAYKGDKETIRQISEYFSQRRTMVDYVHFRQQGFPVGSGTVESGINNVVHHRMKRQGPEWERNNAQGMLAALGELHSGRFESSLRTLASH